MCAYPWFLWFCKYESLNFWNEKTSNNKGTLVNSFEFALMPSCNTVKPFCSITPISSWFFVCSFVFLCLYILKYLLHTYRCLYKIYIFLISLIRKLNKNHCSSSCYYLSVFGWCQNPHRGFSWHPTMENSLLLFSGNLGSSYLFMLLLTIFPYYSEQN